MNWLVNKSNLSGVVTAPPSKSLTIRAIIAASLVDGTSVIDNFLISDDTVAVIEALKIAGIKIDKFGDKLIIVGNTFTNNEEVFNLRSSATAFRMLIFVFLVKFNSFKITANKDLLNRPFNTIDKFFNKYHIKYYLENNVYYISGELKSGQYEIEGHISSQFASGLTLALSTLQEYSTIIIEDQLVSKPYLEMTLGIINHFSDCSIIMRGNMIIINQEVKYNPSNYLVEGDYSQAAFYLVLAALGYNIKIDGLSKKSLQGDRKIIDFLDSFGVKTIWENGLLKVSHKLLTPARIDVIDNPDLFLIIAILASFIDGETEIINIQNLRHKESDRVKSLTDNFDKLGIKYLLTGNAITIYGNEEKKEIAILDGFNDHRVIMSLVVFALASRQTYLIKNVSFITKSYPNFLMILLI